MKKKLLSILSLGLLAALAVGCTPKKNKSSADSSTPSSSSETPEPEWPADLQTLMEKWCGEVLPYVELKAGYTYDEFEDYMTGEPFLAIYDEATSFTLADWGDELEDVDWDVEVNDEDPTDVYYTASKDSGEGKYYFVQYYFDSEYGNFISCWYNELVTELTPNTAWTAEDLEVMNSTLTEAVPFMKFGKGYTVQQDDEDTMYIVDQYYQDLVSDYVSLVTLPANGYVNTGVDDYGDPLLVKTLDDGSTITINPYYVKGTGNVICCYYTPKTTEVATWPSDVVAPYEAHAGVGYTVPSFTATSYEYYVKNGVLHISGAVTSDLEESYLGSLLDIGYVAGSSTYVYNWEETLDISFAALYNDDDAVEGFEVVIAETEPVSTFVDAWPGDQISEFLAQYQVTVPPLALSGFAKKLKVAVYDEDAAYEAAYMEAYDYYYMYYVFGLITEEELDEYCTEYAQENYGSYVGYYVSAYDPEGAVFAQYLNDLEHEPWYVEAPESEDGYYYAEDGTGNCAAYIGGGNGVTTVQFLAGSGEAHEPSLTLNKTALTLKPGMTYQQLVATKSMIAEDVEFSSSEPSVVAVDSSTGKITVANDAALDTQVTITATAGEHHVDCVVTIKENLDFAKITTADELTDGAYLIVCESQGAVMKGATPADAVSNKLDVTINEGTIAYSEELAAEAFTFIESSDGWTIQGGDNKYIGRANDSNGLDVATEAVYNEISFDQDGNVDIVGAGGAHLRFNKNSGQTRFRYFKSTTYSNQEAIQLYEVII